VSPFQGESNGKRERTTNSTNNSNDREQWQKDHVTSVPFWRHEEIGFRDIRGFLFATFARFVVPVLARFQLDKVSIPLRVVFASHERDNY